MAFLNPSHLPSPNHRPTGHVSNNSTLIGPNPISVQEICGDAGMNSLDIDVQGLCKVDLGDGLG